MDDERAAREELEEQNRELHRQLKIASRSHPTVDNDPSDDEEPLPNSFRAILFLLARKFTVMANPRIPDVLNWLQMGLTDEWTEDDRYTDDATEQEGALRDFLKLLPDEYKARRLQHEDAVEMGKWVSGVTCSNHLQTAECHVSISGPVQHRIHGRNKSIGPGV